MLGLIGDCRTETQFHICNDLPCSHIDRVKELYQVRGLFDDTLIGLLIDTMLNQQAEFLSEMCESTLPITSIAGIVGFSGCSEVHEDKGCFTLCGESKRLYTFDYCDTCKYTVFEDDFYGQVVRADKLSLCPTRECLSNYVSNFGWSIKYTTEALYIDIGSDDINKISSLIRSINPPLGERLYVVSDC